MSAAASSAVRSGGFTFSAVWYSAVMASSVRNMWCGVTSQVTGSPSAFAAATRSSPRLVVMCWMCRGHPVRRQSAMSRAISSSSPSAGQPTMPRRVLATPSFTWPSATSESSWQWAMMTVSNWLA